MSKFVFCCAVFCFFFIYICKKPYNIIPIRSSIRYSKVVVLFMRWFCEDRYVSSGAHSESARILRLLNMGFSRKGYCVLCVCLCAYVNDNGKPELCNCILYYSTSVDGTYEWVFKRSCEEKGWTAIAPFVVAIVWTKMMCFIVGKQSNSLFVYIIIIRWLFKVCK